MPREAVAAAVKVGLLAAAAYVVYRVAGNQLEQRREYTPEQLAEARRRYGHPY